MLWGSPFSRRSTDPRCAVSAFSADPGPRSQLGSHFKMHSFYFTCRVAPTQASKTWGRAGPGPGPCWVGHADGGTQGHAGLPLCHADGGDPAASSGFRSGTAGTRTGAHSGAGLLVAAVPSAPHTVNGALSVRSTHRPPSTCRGCSRVCCTGRCCFRGTLLRALPWPAGPGGFRLRLAFCCTAAPFTQRPRPGTGVCELQPLRFPVAGQQMSLHYGYVALAA